MEKAITRTTLFFTAYRHDCRTESMMTLVVASRVRIGCASLCAGCIAVGRCNAESVSLPYKSRFSCPERRLFSLCSPLFHQAVDAPAHCALHSSRAAGLEGSTSCLSSPSSRRSLILILRIAPQPPGVRQHYLTSPSALCRWWCRYDRSRRPSRPPAES